MDASCMIIEKKTCFSLKCVEFFSGLSIKKKVTDRAENKNVIDIFYFWQASKPVSPPNYVSRLLTK